MHDCAGEGRIDELQAALDAACAALLALQEASGRLAGAGEDLRSSKQAELEATELVRAAIRDLRRQLGERTGSPLALGFVRAQPDPDPDSPEDRPSSLRTA